MNLSLILFFMYNIYIYFIKYNIRILYYCVLQLDFYIFYLNCEIFPQALAHVVRAR